MPQIVPLAAGLSTISNFVRFWYCTLANCGYNKGMTTTQPKTKGETMTLDQAYEKINGMNWKLDGVAGKLSVERINGMTEVIHTASRAGRKSVQYRETRERLGDDYTTTISESDEMQKVFARVWTA